MSKEDDERLHNLILFKVYATDKELDSLMPALLIFVCIVLGIIGLILLFCN